MRILALDTSTAAGSVALWEDGRLLSCASWHSGASQAQQLLRTTHQVLQTTGNEFSRMDAFAVASGPGAFTGLRVGMATAKAWGQASGKPVVPVPTLDALAQHARLLSGTVCVTLDARKHEMYAALYQMSRQGVRRLCADSVISPAQLADLSPKPEVVFGPGVTSYADEIRASLGPTATLIGASEAESVDWFPLAPQVASLAVHVLDIGEVPPLYAVRPHYVRRADAEVKAARHSLPTGVTTW